MHKYQGAALQSYRIQSSFQLGNLVQPSVHWMLMQKPV